MKQIPYYERDVDFDALAKDDPEFAAVAVIAKSKGFIDFQNPRIVQYQNSTRSKQTNVIIALTYHADNWPDHS